MDNIGGDKESVIDLTEELSKSDWVGVGKLWSDMLPMCVRLQKISQMSIPDTPIIAAAFPNSEVSVLDFLNWNLPPISSLLLSRPIPERDFVERLEITFGQAWLDGAKAVRDQRFNDGIDRFPFMEERHNLVGDRKQTIDGSQC
ncbi:hypothetical protein BDQ12DRAFT_727868 [Crucibulum laeve]|uniref:Uncharacterized protein n=1 Tax=Crucibulum laeve TaxID=68775 RepID=A0A5C3LL07_9AGAR|nr:hypothetical protein BDQ12DRAFT_727868 [Crucibulum laeve]